ncbi:envelope stress response membrane protein PspC [Croceicoccus naphthovorans]|uniref:Phage-shock protein n=1 Tax=Croceicoccus naphthovorans TaxID=1348774 RepID=A0A0G3XCD0_9SPHN|nr:envelope stress response membrane protein PspC [Croceicoccus naphthovorans]AKM08852.1 phage-shock protein [Croceicoccus naphthovorans]MBB3992298.1 phage shock protein C [Croceicoccus naphthovorans]
MNSLRTRFYRNKAEAKWLGVCAGIADYTGIDVMWVRIGLLISLCTPISGFAVLGYILIGFMAPTKPVELYADKQEEKFWQGVRQSPSRSAREVRGRFREIDRRLARVEEHYVSGNRALSAEIESLR